jgi:hypothetical protein
VPSKISKLAPENGHFEAVDRRDIPHDRKGKHHEIVAQIMQDVQRLKSTSALRVPRSELGGVKIEHLRAALSRAAAKAGIALASRADDDFIYIWAANPRRNGSTH